MDRWMDEQVDRWMDGSRWMDVSDGWRERAGEQQEAGGL